MVLPSVENFCSHNAERGTWNMEPFKLQNALQTTPDDISQPQARPFLVFKKNISGSASKHTMSYDKM